MALGNGTRTSGAGRCHRERDVALGSLAALAARGYDVALGSLAALAARGYDVAGGLARMRELSLEAIYYVGFHLAEEGEPAGEALLAIVV